MPTDTSDAADTTDTPYAPDTTLPEMLATRARRASSRRLTLDVALGALAAATFLVWRPRAWPLGVCAGLCFVAFGAWGAADRALGAGADSAALRAVRGAAVALGTLAALGLAFGVVAFGVGRVIS